MIFSIGGRHTSMSSVTCQISVSLDGFVAGPNQSLENPIGEGGLRLHQWVFETASWREQQGEAGGADSPDSALVRDPFRNWDSSSLPPKKFALSHPPSNASPTHSR